MNDQTIKEFDAIIVGAGFAGIYQLLKLRRLGLSAVILEKADQMEAHGIGIDIREQGAIYPH